MGKLIWYKHSEDPELPEHAQIVHGTKTILIPTDDPLFPPYYALSHELAHARLGHAEPTFISGLSAEIEAVEQTIRQLKYSGEWNEDTRRMTILGLTSHLGGDVEEARWWIRHMENRIDKEVER